MYSPAIALALLLLLAPCVLAGLDATQAISLSVVGPVKGTNGANSLFQLTFSQPLTGFGTTLSTSHFELLVQGAASVPLTSATLTSTGAATYDLQLASNLGNGSYALRFVPPKPPSVCAPVAGLNATSGANVVGNGSPASCTEAAFAAMLAKAGTITFNCGTLPVTIPLTKQYTITANTLIDGGGLVTLDGQDKNRIFFLQATYADYPTPYFQIQLLTLVRGNSAAQVSSSDIGGGGAILVSGGTLTVVQCTFMDNKGIQSQQDAAGGAIYATGTYYDGLSGGNTYIVGSVFIGNSASNGGGLGTLGANLTVQNSIVSGNYASGTGGNPGNGGNAGAICADGPTNNVNMCGLFISANQANVYGKAFFRVGYGGNIYVHLDRSMLYGNYGSGGFAVIYLQDIVASVTNTLIANNPSPGYTVFVDGNSVTFDNVQVINNVAGGSGGGFELQGSPVVDFNQVIISNNSVPYGSSCLDGGVGSGSTFTSVVAVSRSGQSACSGSFGAGTNVFQWPAGETGCFSNVLTTTDPLLGSLSDNGCLTPTVSIGASAVSSAVGITTSCTGVDAKFSSLLLNVNTGATARPYDYLFDCTANGCSAEQPSSGATVTGVSLAVSIGVLFMFLLFGV